MSQNYGGISFSSNAAEIMAQFGDEDFNSDSRVVSRMLADEPSWIQANSYTKPMSNNNEKERLELSCFSGIIGDIDMTLDSHTGRRITVGEFFKRRCSAVDQLSERTVTDRPNFGHDIRSPVRTGQMKALVDESFMTEGKFSSLISS